MPPISSWSPARQRPGSPYTPLQADVLSDRALGSLPHVVLDLLVFLEGAVSVAGDPCVVGERTGATGPSGPRPDHLVRRLEVEAVH
jgi:hypothetical protein